MEVIFNLYIPYKVQDEFGFRCEQEHFSVIINHHYHFPVTYIPLPTRNDGESDASAAIVLVRKYLERKLAGRAIACHAVGPSPFHADFYCSQVSDYCEELVDITDSPGYKKYEFRTNLDDTYSLARFIEKYGQTISLFYSLHNARSFGLARAREAIESTNNLLEMEPRSLKNLCEKRHIRQRIDLIYLNSLREEINRSEMRSLLLEAQEAEIDHEFSDLESHFRELSRFSQSNDFKSTELIANSFEGRRKSIFENMSILIGGLFGGVLGSILTYVLTYQAEPPSNHPTAPPTYEGSPSASANPSTSALILDHK